VGSIRHARTVHKVRVSVQLAERHIGHVSNRRVIAIGRRCKEIAPALATSVVAPMGLTPLHLGLLHPLPQSRQMVRENVAIEPATQTAIAPPIYFAVLTISVAWTAAPRVQEARTATHVRIPVQHLSRHQSHRLHRPHLVQRLVGSSPVPSHTVALGKMHAATILIGPASRVVLHQATLDLPRPMTVLIICSSRHRVLEGMATKLFWKPQLEHWGQMDTCSFLGT
jgi:hypothetical protein